MPHRFDGCRVLLAEPDDAVRDVLAVSLEGAGSVVTPVGTYAAAKAALGSDGGQGFRAILVATDLGAGEQAGWALAASARQTQPGLGIIYLGGEGREAWLHAGLTGSVLLQKPFSRRQLLEALATVLGST